MADEAAVASATGDDQNVGVGKNRHPGEDGERPPGTTQLRGARSPSTVEPPGKQSDRDVAEAGHEFIVTLVTGVTTLISNCRVGRWRNAYVPHTCDHRRRH